MAKKKSKLFERTLTLEEVTDLLEDVITRIKSYDDTITILLQTDAKLIDEIQRQECEITAVQAQLTLRDYEVDLLTKRIISLEEANVKKGCENCKRNSTS